MKQTAYENLAVGIAATSDGTLSWPGVVTNEDTWADNGVYAGGEFAYTSQTGLHYVQLDLGAVYTADQVKVWHYARDGRTYHNTRTQVSADGVAWTTVFDSAVSGEYPETAEGKPHSFTAQGVRYVRDWLNGNTVNAGDHWVEVEVWGTRTTAYVGGHYEKDLNSGVVTKYYHFGGSRVAMQRGGVVYYLLDDHLGSTSLTVDSSGNKVAELRYKAYGETRYSGPPQGTPTDYRFTGQRRDGGIQLYQMGARWYDYQLGRWVSADTIEPELEDPQSLNRYSFVLNNPLKYTDPSGHQEEQEGLPPPEEAPWWVDYLAWLWSQQGLWPDEGYYQFLLSYYSDPALAESWAQACSDTALVLDWMGFGLSGVEAVASDVVIGGATGLGSLAGPEGAAAGFAFGIGFSSAMASGSFLAVPENVLGGVSLLATSLSDVFAGYTFPTEDGWAIGQDTLVTARNTVAGITPESNFDWFISAAQLQYDYDRRNGLQPGVSVYLPQQWRDVFTLLFKHWR